MGNELEKGNPGAGKRKGCEVGGKRVLKPGDPALSALFLPWRRGHVRPGDWVVQAEP